VLEQRLRQRCSESEAQIQRRLQDARIELKQRQRYDYEIMNDLLDDAVDKLAAVVTAERCRVRRSRTTL
jgi:guanylate kinase